MNSVDLPDWVPLVGNFGFPIAITIYLFIRFEGKIGELEKVINNLSKVIENLVERN